MTDPKITIVTPSCNQGQFLEETIVSVLDQRYPDLEYIVLDGGSTDNSVEIIKRYERHLSYWRSAGDDGQAAALREGFEMATGDVLNWLNSDDRLAQGALGHVASIYREHGPDIVVAGGCRVFGNREPVVHVPRFQRAFGSPEPLPVTRMLDMAMHWFPGEFFYQPEVFFPAKPYHDVGGIDPGIYYTMDYDLWMRLALSGLQVVVTDATLAEYREHPDQKTFNPAALHRQMIETANRYLADPKTALSPQKRSLLTASNTLARNRLTRRGITSLRRRLNV